MEVCEKWGADLLRLWVASQDYHSDLRMSKNAMTQLSEAYFKIRNTFRFALGNLSGFDPSRDAVPDDSLEEVDRWMLARTSRLVAKCAEFYEDFDFHRVYHALYDFCVVDLSAFYFDILKDRLYTFAPKGCARRSAQTAIYRIASRTGAIAGSDSGFYRGRDLEAFAAGGRRRRGNSFDAIPQAGRMLQFSR